jgi:hypothetical protein
VQDGLRLEETVDVCRGAEVSRSGFDSRVSACRLETCD